MPRSMWKGVVSFGMVSIPIRLYNATEASEEVKFRQLCPEHHSPISYKRWCPEGDHEVAYSDIERGYEVSKDRYVIIEDSDLDNLPLPTAHAIDISEQSDGDAAQDERARRGEAEFRCLHDRADRDHQRRGDGDRAQHVGATPDADAPIALEQSGGGDGGRQAERQVDEEDPVPAHGLREQAAGEQPDRGARGGDEAEDAEGLSAFVRLREEIHDHGEDHGRADRSADALDEAGGDKHRLRERESAQDGGGGEERKPGQEDPLAAEKVADAAGEEKEAAEGD